MTRTLTISAASLDTSHFDAIIDTRSPAEFAEDHIPGAINCPVLSDEERAEIGTLYKQVSPFEARKRGAILTARNIASAIESHFLDQPKDWRPLIYCWRGGQRSGAMQIVFREIGWDAQKLEGGYKAWRTHVLAGLNDLPDRFRYVVIAGPTGSGKTKLLQSIARHGGQVLDLEMLAAHKGSVLGRMPNTSQTPRKMFDTRLYMALRSFDPGQPVFIEDESARIGDIHLPPKITRHIGEGAVIDLRPTLPARIDFLSRDYDCFYGAPDDLRARLMLLARLHLRARIEEWMGYIDQKNWRDLIRDLLIHHYDPLYARSLARRSATRKTLAQYAPGGLDEMSFDDLARRVLTLPL